jgi:acyl-CoA synthetase (AMP-forming)/AMP-acid ligase II
MSFDFAYLTACGGGVRSSKRLVPWPHMINEAAKLTSCESRVQTVSGENADITTLIFFIAGALEGCGVTIRPLTYGSVELGWEGKKSGLLTVFSSGSTGTPKPVKWDWDNLLGTQAGYSFTGGNLWCGYPLFSFAGLQASITALRAGGVFHVGGSLKEAMGAALNLDIAMATPTTWRRIVGFEDLQPYNGRIGVVSMGGEPVDQPLLDLLTQRLSQARLVHVYATTEVGSVFSVSDGKEGFPSSYLRRKLSTGAQLDIANGELTVTRSGKTSFTGDLVEVSGQRVVFCGRKNHVVLVGGRAVLPQKVEAALRHVNGVADLKIYGVTSMIAGSVLVADVVITPGAVQDKVESDLRSLGKHELLPEELPRRFHFVEALNLGNTGKAALKVDSSRIHAYD